MANLLAVTGCMLLVFLCVGAYFPLSAKMNTPEFLAWQYGSLFLTLLPVFLSGIAVFFVLLTLVVSTRGECIVTKPGLHLIRLALWVFVFVYASSSLQSYEVAHYHNSFIGNQADTRSLTLVNEGFGYVFLAIIIGSAGAFCFDSLKLRGLIVESCSLSKSDRGDLGEVNV